MATSITIQKGTVTDNSIQVRFYCTATYANSNYIVYYGCYETGESRQSGVFSMSANGSYTTSYSPFTGLDPGTEYTFWCELNTTSDTMSGITDELTVKTTGTSFTPPTISITKTSSTDSSVSVDTSIYAPSSGRYYVEFYASYLGTSQSHTSGRFTSSASLSWTFSGIPNNTDVELYVYVYDYDTDELYDYDWDSVTTLGPVRPSNWSWTSTVSKGAAIPYTKSGNTITCKPLTASEWNRFVDRVVEFWVYCGNERPSDYSSWYATQGTKMTAEKVNYMRGLISYMPITVSLPSAASSNGNITAAYINGLKNSLNSIK